MATTVAGTILQQMGGVGRLVAMVNARNFISYSRGECLTRDSGGGVRFRFSGSHQYNHVIISLAADDTYTVVFGKMGKQWIQDEPETGIYCDQLTAVFEEKTGLRLRL